MVTISDILKDIERGCTANNLKEECFSYRLVYFVNEGNTGTKHYVDTPYKGLRTALETIIRSNLSTTNRVVIAQTTIRKGGQPVCLQRKAYAFSLDGYFKQLNGEYRNSGSRAVYAAG